MEEKRKQITLLLLSQKSFDEWIKFFALFSVRKEERGALWN
jgi:hypothetical protein